MNEGIRILFLAWYIIHIPITLLIDLQAIFGKHYPLQLQSVVTWYTDNFRDLLMLHTPAWFQSFIVAELLFQLPFFFVATYGLMYKKNWLRLPSVIYGTHVATTVWPILADLLMSTQHSDSEKFYLFAIYSPYFLIPAFIAAYFTAVAKPFGDKSKRT